MSYADKTTSGLRFVTLSITTVYNSAGEALASPTIGANKILQIVGPEIIFPVNSITSSTPLTILRLVPVAEVKFNTNAEGELDWTPEPVYYINLNAGEVVKSY